jgi:hypothetical protein
MDLVAKDSRAKGEKSSSCIDFSCRCEESDPIRMKDFQFCRGCGDNDVSSFMLIEHPQYTNIVMQNVRVLRYFIEGVINSDIDPKNISKTMTFQGIFVKLVDPKQFTDLVFPSTPSHILSALPKDMKDLLLWKDLEVDLIKVAKKAESILEGVKKRGRDQGDVMDEQTQEALLPQIVYEALAVELVDSVRLLGRRLSAVRAQVSVSEASPSSPNAALDQLEPEVVNMLDSNHLAVQVEFMGADWTPLLVNDIRRFVRVEKMSEKMATFSQDETKRSPLTAFLEHEDIHDKYPALAEVVKQLHALPYELNGKLC